MTIRERVLETIEKKGPLSERTLFKALQVNGNLQKEMKALLRDMVKEGSLYRDEESRYHSSEQEGLMVGRLQGNEKGFGFFVADDEDQDDLYIHRTKINSAMHNDRVLVKGIESKDPSKGDEGRVVTVLDRSNERVVGVYDDAGKFGFVMPDEKKISDDIFIPSRWKNGAKSGQKVVVDIERFPSDDKKAEGKIVEILGYPDEKGVDILSIAYAMGLDLEFAKEVLDEAHRVPQEVPRKLLKSGKTSAPPRPLPSTAPTAKISTTPSAWKNSPTATIASAFISPMWRSMSRREAPWTKRPITEATASI